MTPSTPMSDLDYVILFANKLKENKNLFEQQKRLIEDQLKASSSLFKNHFGKEFKKEARKYLQGRKLIR